MIDTKLANAIEVLKRKSTIPQPNETFEEISQHYDYAISILEKKLEETLLPIKDNLDKRICDVLEEAENTQTFREFLEEGSEEFSFPLKEGELDSMDNIALNRMLEELDWLYSK